jgi:hypothetical protein
MRITKRLPVEEKSSPLSLHIAGGNTLRRISNRYNLFSNFVILLFIVLISDNRAIPCEYVHPSLRDIYLIVCASFGFYETTGLPDASHILHILILT